MNNLYKGYIITKNKKSIMSYKDSNNLLSYEDVKDLEEYAGVLADDVVLIDVDDMEQSKKLFNIVEDLQLLCKIYQSRKGMHFLFKNDGSFNSNKTKTKIACGLEVDIKVGCKNGIEVLKIDGKDRDVLYDIFDDEKYQNAPKYLLPIPFVPDFQKLGKGDGRNQELFNYILKLQSNGFTKNECRECINIINKYILKDKLSDSEIKTITRDEAFKSEVFYDGKTFLFDKFAKYLVSEYNIVIINGQIHIYNNGIYDYAQKIIEQKMIEKIPSLKSQTRNEILKYIYLIAEEKKQSDANYIAFKNGIYDLSTDEMIPYTPDIILTNRIEHNYNKNAYNDLTDKTLNKLSVNDKQIRSLLEECIGYTFLRRNELGKAFILTGDKSNGKSTFLDLIAHILGDKNISALDLRELGDRFSTSMLFGKLANIGDDIGDEFMQGSAVSIFKKIVTGNRIKAEQKGKDPFEFNPYIKLLFSANDMPRMRDKTGAVLRRLVMIPFNATFSKNDEDYDPFIKYKLIKEDSIEYLIKLGVDGLKRVLENNEFTRSDKVINTLKEYEEENNPILGFISEETESNIVNQSVQDVYLRYSLFCSQNQLQALSKIAFSKQICNRLSLKSVTKRIDDKIVRILIRE